MNAGSSRTLACRALAVLALFGLALMAACGGPGGSSGGISLQVGASSLDVPLGGEATATVTLTRSGTATGNVVLDATGAPSWVTVTFSPAVLSGAVLESTMTLATDAGHADAEPTSFTLTVTALGSGASAQDTLEVDVHLTDVDGVAVDAFGEPLAGMTVVLGDLGSVVTGADGAFSFSDVTLPYDLTVVDTADGLAHRFVGLSATEPRVQPISALLSSLTGELEATITGNLVHATLVPLPAQHAATVCIEGLSGEATGCRNVTLAGESSYDLTVNWSSPANLNARVRAYIYEVDADGVPVSMKASGTAGPVVLSDTDAAVLDITLTNTTSQASLTLETALPSGYSLSSRGLVAHYTDLAAIALATGTPVGDSDTLIAPFFPGATHSAYATGAADDTGSSSVSVAWSTGHASGGAATIELPAPATALSPPEGSSNVTIATEFSVANPSGGVVTFLLRPVTFGTGPTLAVTTDGDSATMPNVASLGLALPGSTAYSWLALASHSVTTVDAAVTGPGYLGDYVNLSIGATGGGLAPAADGQISTTNAIEVTTQ